jgi:hypothetical protein
MKPTHLKPGVLVLWTLDRGNLSELYITKDEGVIVLATSEYDLGSIDTYVRWDSLNYNNHYTVIDRRDLPLYMDWYKKATFEKVMRGEL